MFKRIHKTTINNYTLTGINVKKIWPYKTTKRNELNVVVCSFYDTTFEKKKFLSIHERIQKDSSRIFFVCMNVYHHYVMFDLYFFLTYYNF